MTSYDVDVTTSASFLNFFVNAFGSFPQDMCDPRGSKAREATSASAPTCSLYEKSCEKNERLATFIVPRALRKLTLLDVEVTVRAYGSLAPLNKPHEKGERVVHWCHKYRKAREFEELRPWRNRALPRDSESLIQRACLEHHRRMTRLEPGFLVLSVLVYCFVRKRQKKSMVVDLVKLRSGGAVLVCAAGAVGAIEDLALGAPEPPLLVLALIGQALIARNRWPSLVGAVRSPRLDSPSRRWRVNETPRRSRRATARATGKEAKDRVANATTIRRKSEQVVVETLNPETQDDSDTDTDDDDENLNALDDWLARPDKAPAPTEKVEEASPHALVAYNASRSGGGSSCCAGASRRRRGPFLV